MQDIHSHSRSLSNIDYHTISFQHILPDLFSLPHQVLLTVLFFSQLTVTLLWYIYHLHHNFKIIFSYLIHRQTCHSPSQSGWGPSFHDWTLLSCVGTLPLLVRPTAGWLALETVAPLGLSRRQSQRWENSPSGGGPGRDNREQQRGAEKELAHIHPARPGWSYPLQGRRCSYIGGR